MSGTAVRQRFADGRWHFQHGPIDCIVGAEGEAGAVAASVERCWLRFASVLDELVGELPLLRSDLASPGGNAVLPRGPVARRMAAACRPHAAGGRFITAMAAVAGSVAEELIGAFDAPGVARAYVNNGGDIAFFLAPGNGFDIGVVADLDRSLATRRHDQRHPERGEGSPPAGHPERSEGSQPSRELAGRFTIDHRSPVRGVATSGWRGRSFSLGIADAVTVLAASASAADAAATVIGNAVDVADARILRRPANAVRDDSDLGDRLVTCAVPALPAAQVERALANGVREAERLIDAGTIVAAVLCLQGALRVCGELAPARGPALPPVAARSSRIGLSC